MAQYPALLVTLQPQGNGTTVIFSPSFRKTAMHYQDLAQQLSSDMPVYSFIWPEPTAENPPADTLESIAETFLQDLKIRIPHGPFIVGGYCFGSVIALEMAKRLASSGEQVELLVLIDPVLPITGTPWQRRKRRYLRPLRSLRQHGIRFFLHTQYRKGIGLIQYFRTDTRERLEHRFHAAHHRAFYSYQIEPCPHRALLVFSHEGQEEDDTVRYRIEDKRWKEIIPHDREILILSDSTHHTILSAGAGTIAARIRAIAGESKK